MSESEEFYAEVEAMIEEDHGIEFLARTHDCS